MPSPTTSGSRVHDAVDVAVDSTTPGDATLRLVNVPGAARTHGVELFGVVQVTKLLVTALYTLTDATEPEWTLAADGTTALASAGRATVPYQPRHTAGLDVAWEAEETGTWIAVEAFFTGRQRLEHDPYRTAGAPYTVVGVLVSQQVGPVRVFVSGENVGDVRQTHWSPVRLTSPSAEGRHAVTPWAPLEGRVVSVGVRLKGGGPRHAAE